MNRCCTHAPVAAADVEGAAVGELPVDGVQDGGRRQLLDDHHAEVLEALGGRPAPPASAPEPAASAGKASLAFSMRPGGDFA